MSNKQKTFISAIVYICNVEMIIENFLKLLYSVLNNNFEKFEIICANDASTDATTGIIRKLAGNFNNCTLSILNMSYYQGVEATMHAGVDLAIGDFVFEFDSTVMDYDPELIMRIYDRSLQGFDIVSCGSERIRAFSKLFYSIYNRHSGSQYKLKSETFRVISRRAINRVYSMSENLPYRKALYSNCGLKIEYIHYKSVNKNNKHIQTLKNPHDTALTALILFTNIAYKVTLVFTIIMMAATLGTVSYVVTVYITGNPVEGYTTMMLLISGAFFAVFAVLTVVVKYLSVMSGLIFHKQKYVFESIEKVVG